MNAKDLLSQAYRELLIVLDENTCDIVTLTKNILIRLMILRCKY